MRCLVWIPSLYGMGNLSSLLCMVVPVFAPFPLLLLSCCGTLFCTLFVLVCLLAIIITLALALSRSLLSCSGSLAHRRLEGSLAILLWLSRYLSLCVAAVGVGSVGVGAMGSISVGAVSVGAMVSYNRGSVGLAAMDVAGPASKLLALGLSNFCYGSLVALCSAAAGVGVMDTVSVRAVGLKLSG